MGDMTVFLLNLLDILKNHRGSGRGFREKTGLRNKVTEEALQQVIHIVHIVIHIQKAL